MVARPAESCSRWFWAPWDVLSDWRGAAVGPPYYKLHNLAYGPVRYRLAEVLEWQKKCPRVTPPDWLPVGEFAGESAPAPSDNEEWLRPKQAAIALGIKVPTLTAWQKRKVGMPFIWIGRSVVPIMYDRRDIEVFISRRDADPSVVPVLTNRNGRPVPIVQRDRIMTGIWKEMGHSDDQIRRWLGPKRWTAAFGNN